MTTKIERVDIIAHDLYTYTKQVQQYVLDGYTVDAEIPPILLGFAMTATLFKKVEEEKPAKVAAKK